jgi:hypothetical protein
MSKFLMIFALVLAVIRLFIPKHEVTLVLSYEAVAHIFIGILIGAFATTKDKFYLFVLLALTAVEGYMFFFAH